MDSITYRDIKEFTPDELEELFLSVEWSSGAYPEKLAKALKNYSNVLSAWDGDKLVGLICTMDDGVMTAYIHYLLVRPEYQGKGIGRELARRITEYYKDYLRIMLIAYDKGIDFYEHCGFKVGEGKTVMFITSLWT